MSMRREWVRKADREFWDDQKGWFLSTFVITFWLAFIGLFFFGAFFLAAGFLALALTLHLVFISGWLAGWLYYHIMPPVKVVRPVVIEEPLYVPQEWLTPSL